MNDASATSAEKPPVSVWKRLVLGAGLFVLMLTVLAIIQSSFQHSREEAAFEKTIADLDETDPGWRLEDIENARPHVPDEQNSATVVLAAIRLLLPPVFRTNAPPLLPTHPPELFNAKQVSLLEKYLTARHAGLIEARKLADMPIGQFPRDYPLRPVQGTGIHSGAISATTAVLQYDAFYLAQNDKPADAIRSCQAMFNAARAVGDEPLVKSQDGRLGSLPFEATTAAERILALCVPSARDLANLQALAEDEEGHPGYLLGQRGHRARVHELINRLLMGAIEVEDVYSEDDPELGWRLKYAKWTVRPNIRREYPELLRLHNLAVEIARLPLHEQAAAEKDLKDEIDRLSPRLKFVKKWMPIKGMFGEMFRLKVAYWRCLIVLVALERYRQAKGVWPATLDELVPGLLKAVPLDPNDGKPLRYKKLSDGVVVYSVGRDKVDDGGIIHGMKPNASGRRDWGLRLWDVAHRRQPPPENAP